MTVVRSVARSIVRSVASSPIRGGGGGGGGPALDADALSYIAAVEAADTQSLEAAVRAAYNDFIVGCKADLAPLDGISNWTAMEACGFLCAARTLDGVLVPLRGGALTNRGPFVSGDYARRTGLAGNGSSKDILTSALANSFPQDNFHLAVWRTVAEGASIQRMISASSTTARNELLVTASNRLYRARAAGPSVADTTRTTGFVGVARTGASSVTYRYAGTTTTASDASTVPVANAIAVFSGNGASYTTATISFWSTGLAVDLAALDSRVGTFMAAIEAAI